MELPKLLTPGLPGTTLRVVTTLPGAATYETVVLGGQLPTDEDVQLLSFQTPPATAVAGFRSSWGLEFEPVEYPGGANVTFDVRSGRSSNGASPVMMLTHAAGVVIVTIHWSGNWRLATRSTAGATDVHASLPRAGQVAHLGDDTMTLPRVSVATGETREEAAVNLVRLLQGQLPPTTPILTEWNHWWPYEDAEIDEKTFLDNAAVAADIGLDVAVLDAGWFGPDGRDTDWYEQRGDWNRVNHTRFPRGLAALAEDTRALGIEFGIWIEAEAVGQKAGIAQQRPELVARDADGNDLGYVCLGAPAAREHIADTVSRLIHETTARWIKWDFNLDPGAGCSRDDHGHGAADGLWAHYHGLYDVLDRLRDKHPDVVWEACSSGGLRIDAGLAEHVDAFFLSDPDWTEHHLCCLWGACQLLPPRQLLHWAESEWRGQHRFQKVDYSGTLLTTRAFDTKMRAAMLHRFGISARLTHMRADLKDHLRHHIHTYTSLVRPMLTDGVLTPLTPQPLREERGCRQPAFQLDTDDRHLVAAFRLPPLKPWTTFHPRRLREGGRYQVQLLDGPKSTSTVLSSTDLTRIGLIPPGDTDSAFWLLDPI